MAPTPSPLFYHPRFSKFDFGEGHPFRGDRFWGFMDLFRDRGLNDGVRFEVREPSPAKSEELRCVHRESYMDQVEELERNQGYLSIDTQVMKGLPEAALLICGASRDATEALLEEDAAPVSYSFGGFHHAGPDYGEGFCLYNDVAFAAETALGHQGIGKVAVVDTDAHQGNGTMDIFMRRPDVLFISIHQDPTTLYPGRGFIGDVGTGDGEGFTVNVPMPPGASTPQYREALSSVVVPVLEMYKPDLVIRNGGSDPLFGDVLTHLELDYEGLTMMASMVREASMRTAGRQVDLTVSGYGRDIATGWLALMKGTAGLDDVALPPVVAPPTAHRERMHTDYRTRRMLVDLKRTLRPYWGDL